MEPLGIFFFGGGWGSLKAFLYHRSGLFNHSPVGGVAQADGCGSKPMGSHFGLGEFTTHVGTYLSGWIESDAHWGYDLGFDPWPMKLTPYPP